MNNEILNCKESLTEEVLRKIEEKYNFKIPKKIRRHYLKYNGGYPEKSVYHVLDNDKDYIINYFYNINCREGMSLEKTMELLKDENIFPSWLIPLADDCSGNIFAYSVKNNEEGYIYYYSHEFEYGENPEDNIVLLSKDFDEFLESMDYEEE